MTDKKLSLDEIEVLANAATPGPWTSEEMPVGNQVGSHGVSGCRPYKEDADFIAHARTDIPALIAELRAAREALQFYGSKSNYELKMRHASNPIIHHEWESSDVQDDEGKLARKALLGEYTSKHVCDHPDCKGSKGEEK